MKHIYKIGSALCSALCSAETLYTNLFDSIHDAILFTAGGVATEHAQDYFLDTLA